MEGSDLFTMLKFLTSKKAPLTEAEVQKRSALIDDHQTALLRSGKSVIANVLTTERFHPDTTQLSQLAQHNVPKAIGILKQADLDALEGLLACEEKIALLQEAMQSALQSGKKIFISGCGSAGRAGYLIDLMVKNAFRHTKYANQVVPILAGGDASLVKAAEGFEDNKQFGIDQLISAGWQEGDLLIALSASGSADFVHSQLEYVATHGQRKPLFIYCNPDEEVIEAFAAKPIFANPELKSKINFMSTDVGPMALGGSTRMQAATAQVLSVGVPLLDAIGTLAIQKPQSNWATCLQSLIKQVKNTDYTKLAPFVEAEAASYQEGHGVYYEVTANIALNVSTDTSERSPTFNLPYFENDGDDHAKQPASICRTIVMGTDTPLAAYQQMLKRDPIALNWAKAPHTHISKILGWDLSYSIRDKREQYLADVHHDVFTLTFEDDQLALDYEGKAVNFALPADASLPFYLRELQQQLVIKTLLNTHSTLVIGRLNLYYGNLMLYVNPSNMKLVSRGMRLTGEYNQTQSAHEQQIVPIVLEAAQKQPGFREYYLAALRETFYRQMRDLHVGDSVVMKSAQQVASLCLVPPSLNLLYSQMKASARLTQQVIDEDPMVRAKELSDLCKSMKLSSLK